MKKLKIHSYVSITSSRGHPYVYLFKNVKRFIVNKTGGRKTTLKQSARNQQQDNSDNYDFWSEIEGAGCLYTTNSKCPPNVFGGS